VQQISAKAKVSPNSSYCSLHHVFAISWQQRARSDGSTMMGWLDCGTGKLDSSSSSVSGGGGLGGAVSRGRGGLGGAW